MQFEFVGNGGRMVSGNHGVVYTKRWVVDMILDLVGYVPGAGIADKVVVEPSCGRGAFMVAIAERLADEVASRELGWGHIKDAVRGYDVDPGSVKETACAVSAALVAKGCPESMSVSLAEGWLICGDFLLGNIEPCDFVVGNPPYVRATEIDRVKRELYCASLPSVTNGCDLYVGFFDRGIDILRQDGALCFICADRWLQNAYGKHLRSRVNAAFDLAALVRMHGVDAFDGEVDAYPAVTLIRRKMPEGLIRFVNCAPEFGPDDVPGVMRWLASGGGPLQAKRFGAFEICRPEGSDVYPLGSPELVKFVTEARAKLPSLEEAGVRIGIGIATGCDEVFLTEDEHLVEPEQMVPIFYMRDHRRGHPERRRWLVSPWDEDGKLVDLNEYPRLKAYFMAHEERLRRRHVAKKQDSAWYRTIDKLIPGLIERELLLMPDMAVQPDPILTRGKYPHHNCYWIASDDWDLRVLGGLLMADTARRFIDVLGVKMRGGTLRFQAQYLRLVHLPCYGQLSEKTREGLSKAFNEKDRGAATRFAELAYEEAMR